MPITEEVQQALKLSVGGFQLGKILEAVLAALILILAVLSFATMVMGGGSLNLSRRRKTRRR